MNGSKLALYFSSMEYGLWSSPAALSSFKPTPNSGNNLHTHQTFIIGKHNVTLKFQDARLCRVKAKADKSDQNKKTKSVICADCDGNGAVLCSQCQGNGVNSVDFFNGRFKKGDSCWLCGGGIKKLSVEAQYQIGGKKDILCGNCNGAGFIGGFMSTFDE